MAWSRRHGTNRSASRSIALKYFIERYMLQQVFDHAVYLVLLAEHATCIQRNRHSWTCLEAYVQYSLDLPVSSAALDSRGGVLTASLGPSITAWPVESRLAEAPAACTCYPYRGYLRDQPSRPTSKPQHAVPQQEYTGLRVR